MHRTESPNTSDGAIENELAALGKTAPRVTLDDIEAAIASEHYFTAADGWLWQNGAARLDPPQPLAQITFCVLILGNGFRVVGVNTGPVYAENFASTVGRKLARANAIEQCWLLLGYELRVRMFGDAFDRQRDDAGTVIHGGPPPDAALYCDDFGPQYAATRDFAPQEAQKPPRSNTFMGMRFKLTGTLTDAPPGTPPGVATIGDVVQTMAGEYQARVIAEKADLDAKLERLQAFLSTDTCLDLPLEDRELLVAQAAYMRDYARVLARRIERFTQA